MTAAELGEAESWDAQAPRSVSPAPSAGDPARNTRAACRARDKFGAQHPSLALERKPLLESCSTIGNP